MRRKPAKQINPLRFFSKLRWLDGRPLLDTIEQYRRDIFERALFTFDPDGRPSYNRVVCGRGKKNFKSADCVLAALYKLVIWESDKGNQCYLLANDQDQADDDLEMAKALIDCNPILKRALTSKKEIIRRRDGKGFLRILPAGDVSGTHGKTFLFAGCPCP